jgi:hypothetical protein
VQLCFVLVGWLGGAGPPALESSTTRSRRIPSANEAASVGTGVGRSGTLHGLCISHAPWLCLAPSLESVMFLKDSAVFGDSTILRKPISTYCLVVVMERSQSLRHNEWKALWQLVFSQV